jgi:chromosome segregation ATPase
MWINVELKEKLNRVISYLDSQISEEGSKEKKLESKIKILEGTIDQLKQQKRDLEIDLKKIKADNELERKKIDADFNREKADINHLIALDKERAEQLREHERKMMDVQIKEKENELSAKYNNQVRELIEKRDAENLKLLNAHMSDLKQMMTEILKRLPTVTVRNISSKSDK